MAALHSAAAAAPLRGVIGVPDLAARLGERNLVVLDIRSGETREKGAALFRTGHILGAVSIPHTRALGPDNKLLDKASLARNFAAAEGSSIAYCNTGHWAATDWFVLSEMLGRDNIRLYDGSMLEYTLENHIPVSSGGQRAGNGS